MSLMKRHQMNAGSLVATMPAAPASTLPEAPGGTGGLMAGQKLAAFLSAALGEDLKALKDVASRERKAEVKRGQLIPKYRDYVRRLTEAETRHECIGYLLVWLLDAGMVEEGLELARWCVAHGHPLPEGFKATPAYFTADTLITWAEAEFTANRTFEPYLSDLRETLEAAPDAWNVPDALLARMHRLFGLAAEKDGQPELARDELTRALELGAKVKTALEGVLKKLDKPASPDPGEPQD